MPNKEESTLLEDGWFGLGIVRVKSFVIELSFCRNNDFRSLIHWNLTFSRTESHRCFSSTRSFLRKFELISIDPRNLIRLIFVCRKRTFLSCSYSGLDCFISIRNNFITNVFYNERKKLRFRNCFWSFLDNIMYVFDSLRHMCFGM